MNYYRIAIAILAIVAASCSSDTTPTSTTTTPTTTTTTTPTTTTTTSTADPQTCEEVADAFIAINQEFLGELGDMSVEEFEALLGTPDAPGTPWPAFEKLGRDGGMLFMRAADELGCSDQDLQSLALSGARFDTLTPSGPAGELWVEVLGESDGGMEESARGEGEFDGELVFDGSGAAATGGTPLPDVEGAVLGDDGVEPLTLCKVNELQASIYLNFLSEVCFDEEHCFRDAVFTDPSEPDEGSGEWVAGQPFHVRHGFINDGAEPLGDGFDLVLYVFPMDQPSEQDDAELGPTSRYVSDYVLRGTSDQCSPTYRTQTGPETCEWFVHDFPDGLPEGRFALWAVWEAPCSAWVELGFTDSCDDPSEVVSLFSSGVDSPFF